MSERLRKIAGNWETLAKHDPLWSILTEPDKSGNRWKEDEFFATGEREVAQLIDYLQSLSLKTSGERALDFGCGVGRVTQPLSKFFRTVIGIDASPTMIKLARKYNRFPDRVTYHLNRETRLPFPDNFFDLVYSRLVLQHLDTEIALQYVSEFTRTTRQEGVAVFQAPSKCITNDGHHFESPIQTSYGTVTIDMNVLPTESVIEVVNAAGGSVLDIRHDLDAGPNFESHTYCISKR
jgi:SAM-dependent methyltransferase